MIEAYSAERPSESNKIQWTWFNRLTRHLCNKQIVIWWHWNREKVSLHHVLAMFLIPQKYRNHMIVARGILVASGFKRGEVFWECSSLRSDSGSIEEVNNDVYDGRKHKHRSTKGLLLVLQMLYFWLRNRKKWGNPVFFMSLVRRKVSFVLDFKSRRWMSSAFLKTS